ncbi:MAG: hypothetical protein ACODAU_02740 [Myxococcota bacterium]
MRTKHLAAAVLLVAGCKGGEPQVGGDAGAAWLEVGGGEWQFEPLEDGQEVELVRGGQGGYHVWVSLRAGGVDPDNVRMSITTEILSLAGSESGSTLDRDLGSAPEPGTYHYIGWPAVLPEPGCADGEEVEVRVTITDRHGTQVGDRRTVVPLASITPPPCPAEQESP